MEYSGHLEGMLDRDIRTTKTPIYDSTVEVREKFEYSKKLTGSFDTRSARIINYHCCHSSRTKSTYHLKWRKGYSLHHYFINLQNVLTLVVYLILVSIPSVRSAPGYKRMDPPSWKNPCGLDSNSEADSGSGPNSSYNDSDFLVAVLSSIASALNYANEFKEDFSRGTLFNKPFDRAVIEVIPDHKKYEWLVKLPNEYVNKTTEIPKEKLMTFKIDEALREAYIKVQTIAVALTYTVRNQVRNRGQFTEKFEGAYHYLRIVLCELETIMGDCSVAMPPNVEDDIIPSEFHHLDKTESKPYDFVVLREYIKTLNYVTKMLEHLKKGSQEIK